MPEYLLITLFLVINFFHGVFSSGFIPILNKELGVDSALPFSMYFFGIFVGQLFIYKFSSLSKSKYSYGLYEILFAFSLIFMAFFSGLYGFTIGLTFEGLAAGLATPVLFANIINLKKVWTVEKRIVSFSSVTALGFVSGPFVVSYLLNKFDYKLCLLIFGVLFIILPPLTFFTKEVNEVLEEKDLSLKKIFSDEHWFDKFATLFLIKYFYGFLLSFLSSYLMLYYPKDTNIKNVMLVFFLIFILL